MKFSVYAMIFFVLAGCGVKGDPRPPYKPPHLGRGEPTFKEAVKDITPVEVKSLEKKEEDKDDDR